VYKPPIRLVPGLGPSMTVTGVSFPQTTCRVWPTRRAVAIELIAACSALLRLRVRSEK